MPARSPTVRRRRLGFELKALRTNLNLTAEKVAENLDWSASKISRIETAQVKVTQTDLKALLGAYGISGSDYDNLLALARESRETGYWQKFDDKTPVNRFEDFMGFEAEATRVRNYEPSLIPGLLQTADYARAVHRIMRRSDEVMEERINLRLERQKVLLRETDTPAAFEFILDEAALRRPFGGRDRHKVMQNQILRLVEVAEYTNVRLQVVPFDMGSHPSMGVNYVILDLPNPTDPNIVWIESLTRGTIVDDEQEIGVYRRSFEETFAEALGRNASIEFLQSVAQDYERAARRTQ
jgi:transcriptional regulator with XRE-family HTH domain